MVSKGEGPKVFKVTGKWRVVVTITIIIGITAMYRGVEGRSHEEKKLIRVEPSLELSTWVVDWQWKSSIEDLREISKGLTSFQVFAAYFDESDSLYYTEQMQEALPRIFETAKQSGLTEVDLTLVNDLIKKDGTEVQKDSDMITRLMSTDKSREKHIEEILAAVMKYDFHGVEIDYEKIKDSDWDHVCAFYRELYQRLHAMDKSLRIVLESRMPIEKLQLPEGPAYVMMAYNLYGTHSGPGPKADLAFITKLAKRMDRLPGENIIALSAGGFDWAEQGKVTAVTEKRAAELSLQSVSSPKRDNASGSMYFDYIDDDHVRHTVWYADDVTISQWMSTLRQRGYYKIAIWRLGGLGQLTIQELNQ